ncbi:MAG: DUF4131 domain-containing protein, partial [Chloroflexus sp.]|nr:DUF4131 domain-containing protein [Chloroflexus sp.]
MKLIQLAIGWLIGIALAGSLNPPFHWWAAATVLGCVVCLFDRSLQRWMSLSVLCLLLGGLRVLVAQPLFGPQHIERWTDDSTHTLIGYVAEEPRRDDFGQKVVVAITHAVTSEQLSPAEGRILVRFPPYPQYYPGDRLQIEGRLSRPALAQRAGEFDYRAYLARQNIFVIMNRPTAIRKLDAPTVDWGISAISRFREHCRRIV